MNAKEAIVKAAALDRLLMGSNDVDSQVQTILWKAAQVDEMVAASGSTDLNSMLTEELQKQANQNQEVQLDKIAEDTIANAAAFDNLVLEAQAEAVMEKAAAYEQIMEEVQAEQSQDLDSTMQEILQKAALYDQIKNS